MNYSRLADDLIDMVSRERYETKIVELIPGIEVLCDKYTKMPFDIIKMDFYGNVLFCDNEDTRTFVINECIESYKVFKHVHRTAYVIDIKDSDNKYIITCK